MKRALDFILAVICLVLFSPLMAFCAIAIKHEDGMPVIYRQERIGLHGKPFLIYKFRTMRMDAEEGGIPRLLEEPNDPRLTKVGRILRRHHLDELPQLWNVFKGDMAFIGPRPERKYYIDQIMQHDPRYVYLYQIRPGVTLYRHDGEDAQATGSRPLLPGAPLVVVRRKNTRKDVHQHRLRQSVLRTDARKRKTKKEQILSHSKTEKHKRQMLCRFLRQKDIKDRYWDVL